jgi:hypothetical protein
MREREHIRQDDKAASRLAPKGDDGRALPGIPARAAPVPGQADDADGGLPAPEGPAGFAARPLARVPAAAAARCPTAARPWAGLRSAAFSLRSAAFLDCKLAKFEQDVTNGVNCT